MDDKKQSRIVYAQDFDGYNKDNWPAMLTWLSEHMRKLDAAFSEPLNKIGRSIHLQDESEN